MRRLLPLILLLSAFLGGIPSPRALEATTYELANGLQVVVVEDHRAPVVLHSVWYPVGSLHEPQGKTGIAHMLEHLMFKGTPEVPAGQFSKIVAHNGGQDNAFTSSYYTAYYQKIGAAKLPLVMKMEADRMVNLRLTDEVFQPERDVVLEERSWRVDGQPIRRFFEQLVQAHFPTSRLGNPVIGWRKDIENYTLADAQNWYKAYYTPSHATLLVVGDVVPAEVHKLAQEFYGAVPARQVAVPMPKAEPWFVEHQRLDLTDETVKAPVFYRLYRAPSLFAPLAGEAEATVKEMVALSVLAEIFGNGETGTLQRVLVKDKKLADAASMDFNPVGLTESSVDVFVQPKPFVDIKTIETEVDDAVAQLIHKGVSRQELARAKITLKASHVYGRDDLFGTAYALGRWLTAGGTVQNFDDWLAILQDITVKDVNTVAAKYLDYQQATTGLLQPK